MSRFVGPRTTPDHTLSAIFCFPTPIHSSARRCNCRASSLVPTLRRFRLYRKDPKTAWQRKPTAPLARSASEGREKRPFGRRPTALRPSRPVQRWVFHEQKRKIIEKRGLKRLPISISLNIHRDPSYRSREDKLLRLDQISLPAARNAFLVVGWAVSILGLMVNE